MQVLLGGSGRKQEEWMRVKDGDQQEGDGEKLDLGFLCEGCRVTYSMSEGWGSTGRRS